MKQYWNKTAQQFLKKTEHSLWRHYSDRINADLLKKYMPFHRIEHLLKTDLFDEIASRGLYSLLKHRTDFLVCIDISNQVLNLAARSCASLNGVNSDVRCLPFGDETFDAIFSNSTLDHFRTQKDILKSIHEFHRVLKPSGQLIITMDNPENPILAIRNALPFHLLKRLGIVPYYVGRTLSHRRLSLHLKEAGFEIDSVTATMHFPRILIVMLSHLIKRLNTASHREALLNLFMVFEHLRNYPIRFLTGHFVAVSAIKP